MLIDYSSKKIRYAVISIALFLIFLAIPKIFIPEIHSLKLSAENFQTIGIPNDYRHASIPSIKHYYVAGNINYHSYQFHSFHITPDDCLRSLTINEHLVPISSMHLNLCDYNNGFDIDLGPYLMEGGNNLQMDIEDFGGAFSIGIYPDWPKLLILSFISVFLAILILLWKKIGVDSKSVFILSAAIIIYFINFFHSVPSQYNYDWGGHIEYIQHVLSHFSPPAPNAGREFYHPALYYYITALAIKIFGFLGYNNTIVNIRLVSLGLFIGFLTFSALTLRSAIKSRFYYLALSALVFWPVGVTMASRINNDIPLYFFYSAAFYYLVLWIKNPSTKLLSRALIFSGLAVATKSNGLILFPIIALTIAYKWKQRNCTLRELFGRQLLIPLLLCIALCSTNFGRTAYYHFMNGTSMEIVSNTGIFGNEMRVINKPYYFLSFNYDIFMQEPFFNVLSDQTGRQYFWNTLLKSSLFGEFTWREPTLAIFLSFILLLMILYAAVPVISVMAFSRKPSPASPEIKFYLIALIIPLLSLAMARITYPLACSQDFRYIYPVIIPCLIIYNIVLEWSKEKQLRTLYGLGIFLITTFTSLCLIFILMQHFA